jgi:hypothetical protein
MVACFNQFERFSAQILFVSHSERTLILRSNRNVAFSPLSKAKVKSLMVAECRKHKPRKPCRDSLHRTTVPQQPWTTEE